MTFEKYLVVVGAQLRNHSYDSTDILNNIDYFRKCFSDGLTVSYALDKFIEIL